MNHLREALLSIVKESINPLKASLVIDDTLILKKFAELIQGIFLHYDPTNSIFVKGFSIVVIGASYRKLFFPLDFAIWLPKEIMNDNYKSKQELAIELISKYSKILGIKRTEMDGLYATINVMRKLDDMKVKFTMRIHSNRVVTINNISQQLKLHKSLRPTKNSRAKMLPGNWKGMDLFFTCLIYRGNFGEKTFSFLVSNIEAFANEYLNMYNNRWTIECFFRTIKQKFGLADCQSRDINKQKAHFYSVFLAYSVVSEKALKFRKKSVDDCINQLRIKNQSFLFSLDRLSIKSLVAYA
jgi:hypothetical protein